MSRVDELLATWPAPAPGQITRPGYHGWPLVMAWLAGVDVGRLGELVTEPWRMRSPDALAGEPGEADGPPGRRTGLSETGSPEDALAATLLGTGRKPHPALTSWLTPMSLKGSLSAPGGGPLRLGSSRPSQACGS
jgi:hypothetical protein